MNPRVLQQAVALGRKLGHIFVATADRSGLPHVAAASKMALASEGRVEVCAWFCPGTLANLSENKKISLVVWDPERDLGYQVVGEAEGFEDLAMMDGYDPGEEKEPALPQAEKRITLRVKKILDFRHAPHSDREE